MYVILLELRSLCGDSTDLVSRSKLRGGALSTYREVEEAFGSGTLLSLCKDLDLIEGRVALGSGCYILLLFGPEFPIGITSRLFTAWD